MNAIPFRPDLDRRPTPPSLEELPLERYEPHARLRPSSHAAATICPPPVAHALATVTMGTTVEHRSLAVTPLLGDDDPACDYLTVDEAFATGCLSIREVSVRGHVNKLRVTNRADRALLIVDGEEFAGSVQNRVVNLSMLVGSRSQVCIPVSCVERGRSDGETFRFTSAPRIQFASGRARKMTKVSASLSAREERQPNQAPIWSLIGEETRHHHATQASVWSAIAEKAWRMQVISKTDSMGAIYDRHVDALDEFVRALGSTRHQRGAVFSVGGRLAGMELFDSASTWHRLMRKVVCSYAIDALEQRADQNAESRLDPARLLDAVADAETRSFVSFGDGFDVRMNGKSVTGGALVFGGRVIHLAAFASPETLESTDPR